MAFVEVRLAVHSCKHSKQVSVSLRSVAGFQALTSVAAGAGTRVSVDGVGARRLVVAARVRVALVHFRLTVSTCHQPFTVITEDYEDRFASNLCSRKRTCRGSC